MGGNKTLLSCYLSNRPQLLHYAGRILGDTSQAEDIVQEAWVRCHEIHPEHPLNFLYRVIRNLALDTQRKMIREDQRFVRVGDEIMASVAADIPGLDTEIAARQELERVMEGFRDLPELTKQAIILYRFDGLKLREIAKILDLSIARVHGLVVEGMERCRVSSDPTE
ncbi:hypothetical protein HC62_11260 [Acetobacter tropicalis]|uniref:Uncharacterized protein n=1 Tax=Acetobacter tropicalis TaxID=104102 RepID=A0A252A7A7_9PROT|nr:hypothetical protein HC62_11260 [Acetobacter tropicalis]